MRKDGFDKLKNAVHEIIYNGYPLAACLAQLHSNLIENPSISDLNKALICEKMAEVIFVFTLITNIYVLNFKQTEQCLLDGSSEYLQLSDLTAFIMRRLQNTSANVDELTASNH